PQPPEQRHLLLEPPAPVRELLPERLVLDRVPSDTDAETELSAGEEVDLGRLLGRQDGLTLREDDDAGHEFHRRDRGGMAEEAERLVERGRYVVRTAPGVMHVRVGTDDVVVGEHVREPELLHPLAVGAHRADVAAELGLREHDSDPHYRSGRFRARFGYSIPPSTSRSLPVTKLLAGDAR